MSEFAAHRFSAEYHELSDTFYTNKKSHTFCVKLNASGFNLQRQRSPQQDGTKEQLVKLTDIIGGRCLRSRKAESFADSCTCTSSSATSSIVRTPKGSTASRYDEADDEGDGCAYLYVFAYILKRGLRRKHFFRERTMITLRFRSFDSLDENMREADRWYRALRWHIHQTLEPNFLSLEEDRRRRFLILLNPKSGAGKGREIFNHQVAPILNEAEVPYDLHITKHSNYAMDFVRLRSLDAYSCIVAVGGDGLFHEIVNGLFQRTDWSKIFSSIALGIVPCGSGNGLARSIAHSYKEPYGSKPILGAVLATISGQTSGMDLVRVELNDCVMYSFLSIGWGFISDVDIESERLRILGYQRFTLWTLHRLLNLRTYRGKLSYRLKREWQAGFNYFESSPSIVQSASCISNLDQVKRNSFQSIEFLSKVDEFQDVISLETSLNRSCHSRADSWRSRNSQRSYYYSIPDTVYHSIAGDSHSTDIDCNNIGIREQYGPDSTLPPLGEPVPKDWCTEEGNFVMVHAAYPSHLGADCYFAPAAELDDATIYLVIVRSGISRHQLLNFMLGLSTGTHLAPGNEFVKVYPVSAFRLEPYDNLGIITIDGERVDCGHLQAEVLPSIARITVPKKIL